MKKRILIFVFALSLLLSSCVLDPGARREMDKIDLRVQELVVEGGQAADQIKRLLDQFNEIRAAAKDGKISPEKIAELIGVVGVELKEAKGRYSLIKDKIGELNEAQLKVRDEYGVPWWQVALNVAFAAVTSLSGIGLLKLNGVAKAALGAGRVLIKSIEMGGSGEEIKARVKSEKNETVNKIVSSLYG